MSVSAIDVAMEILDAVTDWRDVVRCDARESLEWRDRFDVVSLPCSREVIWRNDDKLEWVVDVIWRDEDIPRELNLFIYIVWNFIPV